MKTIIVLVVFGFLLLATASAQTVGSIVNYGGDDVIKYYDHDESVICYRFKLGNSSLSCVKDN